VERAAAPLLIRCLVLAGLAACALPAFAQSPDDGTDAAATPAASIPAATDGAASPPAATTPTAPAKKKTTEVLPWADKPLTAVEPAGDVAAAEAAAAQCSGLFEAACRDLKTCAWVGTVIMNEGTEVPPRCVVRPPAPPKKAAKKKDPAKAAAAAPEATGETPAPPKVKEAESPPENPVQKKAATTLDAPSPAVETKESEPAKAAVEAAPAEAKQEAKAPIVVKPPPAAAQPPVSFGSVSPIMPGDNAVVVTVPPSN